MFILLSGTCFFANLDRVQMGERWENLLCCPFCHGSLEINKAKASCRGCGEEFKRLADGRIIFLSSSELENLSSSFQIQQKDSQLHQLRNKYPKILDFPGRKRIIRFWGTAHFVYLRRDKEILKTLFPEDNNLLILDLGAGENPLHPGAITIDADPQSTAQIIANVHHLPFPDQSLDGVVACGLFEHLKKPWECAKEIIRVLKPGGYVYIEVPLLQGIHYNPFDEQRFTPDGLETLFSGLETIKKGVLSGPGSALAHLLPHWLAMVFSFNSSLLYEILFLIFSLLTFPIKYTDAFLIKHPRAERACFAVYYFGRKSLK